MPNGGSGGAPDSIMGGQYGGIGNLCRWLSFFAGARALFCYSLGRISRRLIQGNQMRKYSQISPQFWIGEMGRKIRDLGRDAQIVALYVQTSPHANMLGLYYLPIDYLSHETGIPLEGASKALRRLDEVGFCRYDHQNEVIWVCEMASDQMGPSLDPKDKRVKGVANEYEALPKCKFLEGFFSRYHEAFHLSNRRADSSPLEAPSKPPRSIEQKGKDTEEKKEESIVASQPVRRVKKDPYPELARLSGNGKNRVYPSAFDAFWQNYPKRPTDTKAGAYEHWRRRVLKGRVTCDELIAASKAYGEFCLRTGHEALLVSTWCRREGWTASYKGGTTEATKAAQETMEEMFKDG